MGIEKEETEGNENLSVYRTIERPILEDTTRFYQQERSNWLAQDSADDYLVKVWFLSFFLRLPSKTNKQKKHR